MLLRRLSARFDFRVLYHIKINRGTASKVKIIHYTAYILKGNRENISIPIPMIPNIIAIPPKVNATGYPSIMNIKTVIKSIIGKNSIIFLAKIFNGFNGLRYSDTCG